MEPRLSRKALLQGAAVALVLAYPTYSVLACTASVAHQVFADGSRDEKSKAERDCGKRADGQRASTPRPPCPEEGGGDRLPQEKRSPLDSLPPLSPLVA